jgi:DNA-binding ferritin-like protein
MFNPDEYIVFKIETKVPGNTVRIKEEKKRIADDNNASESCVNATKEKWAKDELYTDVISCINTYKNKAKDLSSPWGRKSGDRIATKKMWLEEIEPIVNEGELEVQKRIAKFISNYQNVRDNAKNRLGSLYEEADYPDVDYIKSNFYMTCGGAKAPDPKDNITFVGSKDAEERFKKRIEKKIQANFDTILEDITKKVAETIGKVANRMESYSIGSDGKVSNAFRDSTISNANDLASIIQNMNINSNKDIEKMRKNILKITRFDPNELRESSLKRELIAKESRDILGGLSGLMRKN